MDSLAFPQPFYIQHDYLVLFWFKLVARFWVQFYPFTFQFLVFSPHNSLINTFNDLLYQFNLSMLMFLKSFSCSVQDNFFHIDCFVSYLALKFVYFVQESIELVFLQNQRELISRFHCQSFKHYFPYLLHVLEQFNLSLLFLDVQFQFVNLIIHLFHLFIKLFSLCL